MTQNKQKSALVVSAHSADFVWRAGGAIALYAGRGWRVKIVCLSFGERGESAKLWKESGMTMARVKAQRRQEALAAASLLGAEVEFLGRFDIGVMPMPDDKWTRGKGGYKLLQYMAMGIPCISSPVGINREIVKHDETGFLAESEEDWFQFLERLILDDQLRSSMGTAGRQRAQSEYSFETFTPKLIKGMHLVING